MRFTFCAGCLPRGRNSRHLQWNASPLLEPLPHFPFLSSTIPRLLFSRRFLCFKPCWTSWSANSLELFLGFISMLKMIKTRGKATRRLLACSTNQQAAAHSPAPLGNGANASLLAGRRTAEVAASNRGQNRSGQLHGQVNGYPEF